VINKFRGEYEFLSNFYNSSVIYNGFTFPTVENAYQAAKCKKKEIIGVFQDLTASQAKKLGNKIDLKDNWEDIKLSIMYGLLIQKFSHVDLKIKLLNTGNQELIEGNYWGDTFWGVCQGIGENNLGRLLMLVRKKINTV